MPTKHEIEFEGEIVIPVKISSSGQITIPAEYRSKMDLKSDDWLFVKMIPEKEVLLLYTLEVKERFKVTIEEI